MHTNSITKAVQKGGLALGALLMLFTAAPALAISTSVTTQTPTSVSTTSMTLTGFYNIGSGTTGGADTWFQWGTTSAMGPSTPIVHDTHTSDTFTAQLTGLTPNTTYYFRALANSSVLGPSNGATLSVTTASIKKPQVLTNGATHTATTATLSGYFNSNGTSAVSTEFAWGTSASNLSNETGFTPQSSTYGDFSQDITGLSPNTTYYFKAEAQGSATTVSGAVIPFTTDQGNGGNTGASCVIDTFTASPASINSGDSSTLNWTTSNCTTVSLSGGNFGTNTVESGTSAPTGSLGGTTVYVLTASDSSGTTVTDPVTVTVASNNGNGNGGNTGTSACSISSFYPSPAQVAYDNSTTLYWTTSGCSTLSVTPNIGSVSTGSSYVQTGSIYSSTTYTLTGTDSNGLQSSATTTVNVTSNNNGGSSYCAVNSFYANPTSVTSGQNATLNWNTTGCSTVTITGGSLTGYSYLSPVGSLSTGALTGTTQFVLTANGTNSTSSSTTVYVTNSQYPYVNNCANGSTDPSCAIYNPAQTTVNVVSLPASNVGANTTRLNGIVVNSTSPETGYFEYGTNIDLGSTTAVQAISSSGNLTYFDTISVLPNTTYYYRAVIENSSTILRGPIMSFTTPGITAAAPVYVNSGFGYDTGSTTAVHSDTLPAPTGITLTITDGNKPYTMGTTVDYTVTYANGSSKKLTNVGLSLVLPEGMTLVQTTQGRMTNPTTIQADLGTLAAGQTGSIFIQANVGSVSTQETLVTNGTLTYTYPNGTTDSTVGYVLNHGEGGALGGLGIGFFPTTVLGWLITILIILALILVIRRIIKSQDAGHGHGGAAHH